MLDYLDDIASDLSVFHRIDDAGEMESAVFFALACRLPAYSGVLAARVASESAGTQPAAPEGQSARHVPGSAASAATATPLDRTQIVALNAQLGGQYFSHAAVPGG